jgi:6-pyruvoyl-tetrahydropterin synthase
MNAKALKEDLVQWVEGIDDPSLIKDIWAFKTKLESGQEISNDQIDELKKRLAKNESGNMGFSSWDRVKKSIRKKTNNAV